ncbi:MAG: hypothetical protein ACI8TX_001829 [Hyphomicrobiaceae bacterium]|jgi:hypothetical protein
MWFSASAVIVFGLFGLLVAAAKAGNPTDLPLPTSWLIHARTPIGLLAVLAAGVSLGLASVWRAPRWFKFPVIALEIGAAGLLAFYFLSMSMLPDRTLGIGVGDTFPAYTLADQDGVLRRYLPPGTARTDEFHARNRALYIFYRGDW